MDGGSLKVEPLFARGASIADSAYSQMMANQVSSLLGKMVSIDGIEDYGELFRQLKSRLPLVQCSGEDSAPCDISFYLISRQRPNAFKFFYEMISRWLIPGKLLDVNLFSAIDFRLPQLSDTVYTFCEIKIHLEDAEELKQLCASFPIVESEISLGMASAYHARRILEVRGLEADEKTAMIHEYIALLLKRFPDIFSDDIFSEMQQLLVKSKEDFRKSRQARHISRIVGVHYLFRKELEELVQETPHKRFIKMKVVRARLQRKTGMRPVLGVMVGVNFLRDKEFLEDRQLLKAIRHFIPNVDMVRNSFYQVTRGKDNICTLYIEIEKIDGASFTSTEICRLRKELSFDIRDRIERLVHPVFMPSNEEEIMRNILTLSNQIRFLRDIPQVMITYDQQSDQDLVFTVIFVRILKPGGHSLQAMFTQVKTPLEYLHDRCKSLGYIRKRYPKEATVFHVKLPKERFLRRDHSIDLYRARRFVVGEMTRILGEFRDFNGGMISKQDELLRAVRNLLVESGQYYINDLLLENLFYAITPVIMRSVLAPSPLRTLFLMLAHVVNHGFSASERHLITHQEDKGYFIVLASFDDAALKDKIIEAVDKLNVVPTALAKAFVSVHDVPCLGYIYHCDDPKKRERLLETIRSAIMENQRV